jgi:ABC-type multidrug transport system permease subunit
MKAWFRTVAAAFSSEATAQTVAGISVLAIAIYTGLTFLHSGLFLLILIIFEPRFRDS